MAKLTEVLSVCLDTVCVFFTLLLLRVLPSQAVTVAESSDAPKPPKREDSTAPAAGGRVLSRKPEDEQPPAVSSTTPRGPNPDCHPYRYRYRAPQRVGNAKDMFLLPNRAECQRRIPPPVLETSHTRVGPKEIPGTQKTPSAPTQWPLGPALARNKKNKRVTFDLCSETCDPDAVLKLLPKKTTRSYPSREKKLTPWYPPFGGVKKTKGTKSKPTASGFNSTRLYDEVVKNAAKQPIKVLPPPVSRDPTKTLFSGGTKKRASSHSSRYGVKKNKAKKKKKKPMFRGIIAMRVYDEAIKNAVRQSTKMSNFTVPTSWTKRPLWNKKAKSTRSHRTLGGKVKKNKAEKKPKSRRFNELRLYRAAMNSVTGWITIPAPPSQPPAPPSLPPAPPSQPPANPSHPTNVPTTPASRGSTSSGGMRVLAQRGVKKSNPLLNGDDNHAHNLMKTWFDEAFKLFATFPYPCTKEEYKPEQWLTVLQKFRQKIDWMRKYAIQNNGGVWNKSRLPEQKLKEIGIQTGAYYVIYNRLKSGIDCLSKGPVNDTYTDFRELDRVFGGK